MHIPDGFIDLPTSVAAGAVGVGGVAVAVRRTRDLVAEQETALAGMTAAFVFAVQMMNFPVAAGTSGHLLGGVLAAVLVGPWVAVLCLTTVLVVQCLLFADGGLSALGLNVVNMALVGCLGGWVVFRGLRGVLPRTHTGVVVASGVAGGISVVLASVAFTVEYAIGGTADLSLRAVALAMVGTHALIGVGEGVITGAVVAAVLAARPDLVCGARDFRSSRRVATAGAGA